MILVPSFDIPSGFRLGKITEECPFQGPVFFGVSNSLLDIHPDILSGIGMATKYSLGTSNI